MNRPSRAEIVQWPAEKTAQAALVRRAAELLRAGEVVAFPTDTVYGIAADPTHEEAVRALYSIKGRPPEKAIALLVGDEAQLESITEPDLPGLQTLTGEFWPGAVTVVVPALPDANVATGQPFSTVGLRMPDHMIPLCVLEEMRRPLATTSANLSGAKSAVTAEDVDAQIGDRIALIIDGGRCPVGRDSTVVDITVTPPAVRRLGAVPAEEIIRVLGEVDWPRQQK